MSLVHLVCPRCRRGSFYLDEHRTALPTGVPDNHETRDHARPRVVAMCLTCEWYGGLNRLI